MGALEYKSQAAGEDDRFAGVERLRFICEELYADAQRGDTCRLSGQYRGVARLEDLPPLATPKEVSATCRRSLSGVYEDIRSGPLKAIAVHWGRRVFIPRDALIELIKGGEL